jgi:hypothetical protein
MARGADMSIDSRGTAVLFATFLVFASPALGQQADTATHGWIPVEQQTTAAVLPLPEEFRSSATVMGYRQDASDLEVLRAGDGAFTCLAPNPAASNFHVACYHRSLEPFMERGRSLRASGVTGDQVDTVRFREVDSGRIRMPEHPAALYSLSGPIGSFVADSGTVNGARPLFVIYIPGATSASTGLSEKPAVGTPWIMFPGTPKAHIMFVPRM